jgi:hypothetical protein
MPEVRRPFLRDATKPTDPGQREVSKKAIDEYADQSPSVDLRVTVTDLYTPGIANVYLILAAREPRTVRV